MNKQMKNILLVGIATLLFSACGGLEIVPTPVDTLEPIVSVTKNPTHPPTANPTEDLNPEKFSQYIGLTYPPLPDGLSPRFSMIIQGSGDHTLSFFSEGKSRMLWLSQMTHSDAGGAAYWEVKDILDLSHIEAGSFLSPDGCFLNGRIDNEILVVSKNGKALLAWRANTTSDVFEVIPIDGIQCNSDKPVFFE